MALQKETWLQDIQENLFKNNVIINRAVSHDGWITNKTVHIPQAGANPTVTKNLGSFPATVTQRTDTDLTYTVDTYYLDPVLIEKGQEAHFISYDKRMSVMGQQIKTLEEILTNQALYKWAPSGASRIRETTGSAVATALAPSATGNRNAITLADIAAAKNILDVDGVEQEGRILVIPSAMFNAQLLDITEVKNSYAYGSANLPSGVVARLLGFDIVVRASVVVYDNTSTPVIKAIGDNGVPSSPATTDNLAALAYHPGYVCKAKGDTSVNINEDAPGYYGSTIIESMQHFGAAKLRTGQEGICAIVQQ